VLKALPAWWRHTLQVVWADAAYSNNLGARMENECGIQAEAKRENGGYLGRVPGGFISVEDDQPHRKSYACKTHHIEPGPERAHIW